MHHVSTMSNCNPNPMHHSDLSVLHQPHLRIRLQCQQIMDQCTPDPSLQSLDSQCQYQELLRVLDRLLDERIEEKESVKALDTWLLCLELRGDNVNWRDKSLRSIANTPLGRAVQKQFMAMYSGLGYIDRLLPVLQQVRSANAGIEEAT